jgi:hypothetical protein
MLNQGCQVSPYIVKQLLELEGLGSRSMLKSKDLNVVKNRNEQFEKIQTLRQYFSDNSLPILSIDTKKNRTAEAGIVG